MNRPAPVVTVLALAGLATAIAACGSSDDDKAARIDCSRSAAGDASYSGKFEGPVSMGETKHVIRVTRNGRPVSGARVCINAKMVGMSSMHYTAKGNELAPGRYQVGFQFEMAGTYQGNVVTKRGGKQVSVPVTVKVPSGKKSGGMDMAHGGMRGMAPLARGADGTSASAGGLTLKVARTTAPSRRSTVWTIRVLDAHGKPVTRFDREQTKLMHLIVVRDDFTGYQHLHPVLHPGGRFTLPVTLPAPGRYRAIADFTVKGTRYPLGVGLTARGKATAAALPPARRSLTVDGYTVKLAHGALTAGSAARLRFNVLRSGRPVTALQPYLGAFGHLVALRKPDLSYSHVHPIAHDARAGTISFHAELPSAATYRLFLQFRAAGAVHTAPFTVAVGK